MEYELINYKVKSRFEVHVDGKIAFEDHKLFNGDISYIHTDVPKELESKGLGSFIDMGILDYADENNLKVKPYCPFIKAYIGGHPEYQANSMFHNKALL